jgi:serine/threonine protein kinase
VADASDEFKSLLKRILSKDPTQRPTFADILSDPFFANREEEKFNTSEEHSEEPSNEEEAET